MVHPLSGYFSYKDADFADIYSRAEDGNLEAIAVGAAILEQGFWQRTVDIKLSRDWLEQGAAIEAIEGDDKLCTVMLAMTQGAKGHEALIKHSTWIIEQAEQDHTAALRVLSYIHAHGIGVPKNVEAARDLAMRGARRGNPFAMYDAGMACLGNLESFESDEHSYLRKIKIDPVMAGRHLKAAALMGHADAQQQLGLLITHVLSVDEFASQRIADLSYGLQIGREKFADLQNPQFGADMLKASAAQRPNPSASAPSRPEHDGKEPRYDTLETPRS